MPDIPIEKFLKPLSGDRPCGPDLDSDTALGMLWRSIETSAKGEAEQQFGDKVIEGKPADWQKVGQLSMELLESCRHLGAAVYLTASALRTNGFAGFTRGIQLIKGLVDSHWENLHPLPDPDEPDDYFERVGLFDLMTPGYREGFVPDPLSFVEGLRTTSLARSPQSGSIDYSAILAHRAGMPEAPPAELIKAAFADTDPDALGRLRSNVEEATRIISDLQETLNEKLKEDSPNFANLRKELEGIGSAIKEYAHPESPGAQVSGGGESAPSADVTQGTAPVSAPGSVPSRADVIRTLNTVIAYYTANEPSSPIPFLLERAKQLVNNDFFGVIRNFRPDLEKDFLALLGAGPVGQGKAAAPPQGQPVQPPSTAQPKEEKEDPWKNVRI